MLVPGVQSSMSIFVCSDILIITGLENPTSSVNEIEVRNQSKIVRINKIMRLSPFGSDVLRPFSGIFVVCVCVCVCVCAGLDTFPLSFPQV